MTNTQKVIVGLIAAAGLLVLGFAGGWATKPVPSGTLGLASVNGYEAGVKWFGNGFYAGLSQQFGVDANGAVTSATTTNTTSYWTEGGIDYASVQVSMIATSSVPCAIPNPWFGSATTTALNAMAQILTNGISGTQTWDISTSSTIYATSTPAFVKKRSVAAGQASIFWTPGIASSTINAGTIGYDTFSTTGASPYVLAPSEYLTFAIATGTPGAFSAYYTGTCSATFMKP